MFVYPTVEQVDGMSALTIMVATCSDAHCAVPPESQRVWSQRLTGVTIDVGKFGAWFAPDGSMLIAFDYFDFPENTESEMDALSQYVLMCREVLCHQAELSRIGPVESPTHPAGAFPLNLYGVVPTSQNEAFIYYESPGEDFSLDIYRARCSPQTGCTPDPSLDPLIYSLPTDGSFMSLTGDATLGSDGLPLLVTSVHRQGQPTDELLLAACDTTECTNPTHTWIAAPASSGESMDTQVVLGPDGNPVIAQARLIDEHLDLYVTACEDPRCEDYHTNSVAVWVRRHWDIDTDTDGTVHLVWADYPTDEAVIAKCGDAQCSTFTTVNTGIIRTEDWLVDLAIGSDHNPMLTFQQPNTGLQLFNCLPQTCALLADS